MKTKIQKLIQKLQKKNKEDCEYLREQEEAFAHCSPEEQIAEEISRAVGRIDANKSVIRALKRII